MHKIVLLLSFFLLGMKTYSQQQYFVYIQTDNNQPFYVRMNEKIFSSSPTGYLILSRLSEKSYDFYIGFARNAYPEQQFRLGISNKDKGYQLKNFVEKGWGLVDLQSQEVIMNLNTASVAIMSGERKTDPFSVMLASVVNDSAILYTQPKPAEPVAVVTTESKKTTPAVTDKHEALVTEAVVTPVQETRTITNTETKQPETAVVIARENEKVAEPPIKKDSAAIVAKSRTDSAVVSHTDTIASKTVSTEKPVPEKPFITRIKESRGADGYQAIYLEQYNYTTDTIDILIPIEATAGKATQEKQVQPVLSAPVVAEAKNEAVSKDVVQKDNGKTSIALQMGSVTDTFTVKKKTIIMTNSDCKNFATENDVDKLRIKLLGEKTIDEKLSTARKYYRNKCFTVKQLRALTELFPTDETKYRFLDLSYAFSSDSGNYYLLEEVMGEDYYKNRFRAMIRK